jgi:DNA-binding response OmpR family regulator
MTSGPIVVIEDNVDFATILETVLKLWGYAVMSCDTLGTGKAAITRVVPAMLILDGQLPDGDGFDLYRELRAHPATQQLPILLLSVSDDVYQLARAASSRDPYFTVGLKPMPLEEIQVIVARMTAS